MKRRKPKIRRIKKRLNKRNILIFAIIIVLLVFIIIQFYSYYKLKNIKEIKTFEMKLEVSDHIGFNLENETLNFGTVIPSGSATRNIKIESDEPVFLNVNFKGNLAEWVDVSENNFVFNGTKDLTFVVYAPWYAEAGNYTGKAVLIFKEI